MAKAYSLLSWNVEHFRHAQGAAPALRLQRIVDTIQQENPDVFALYEVEGNEVFTALVQNFPGYSFHITEGPQTQEILVAVRGSISSFFTQRLAFKSGVRSLRPGALLTLTIAGESYPILFLHLKSKDDPRSFGLRDDMLRKAIKFHRVLGGGGTTANIMNYLFIGDLNTMGMDYYFNLDIPVDRELERSDRYATGYYGMHRVGKTFERTWSNGSNSSLPDSDLDHCYAVDHLQFRMFSNKDRPGQSPVDVRGWVDAANTAAKDAWIDNHSDHSYLFLEVQRV